ncbi:MAG: LamG-like jellyroll fold domain-containing protein [Cytophagales bacterium]|nr:LamG-like jellyroll fold domain-containing protein [Cytophagales bacterium]
MCKKELLLLLTIMLCSITLAQSFEEISCEAYYQERAYFGTSQRSITIVNKTNRTVKLVYKNGEQEEFDIFIIRAGKSQIGLVFNNATLCIKDFRSEACIQALRINDDEIGDIKVELSKSKFLKEIARQDPATGKDILKIDCAYSNEEFEPLNLSRAITMTNKTEGPLALHVVRSEVGKTGRPFLVIPPSESKTFNHVIGNRFMLKDKSGECVGVYEVLGDASLVVDDKEMARNGSTPVVWEEEAEQYRKEADNGDSITFAEIPKEGLALWMRADSGVNVTQGRVSSWQDLSGNDRHVNQRHWQYSPLYLAQGLNNQPALYFSKSYLKTEGSFLVGKDYTMFVVHHYHRKLKNNFLLTGGEALSNQGLSFGYHMGKASQYHGENKLDAHLYGHHTNKATLMTFSHSAQEGRRVFVNDEMIGSGNTDQDKEHLIALRHLAIGGYKTRDHYFTGLISEILIYDRALSQDQITEIQHSLMGQYRLGEKIPNQLEDPTLLTREAPDNYQPILLELPPLPSSIQKAPEKTNPSEDKANPALLASLVKMGIDIPADHMKLWLKADTGLQTSPLNARAQMFVERGGIIPPAGIIDYVDRWADQSGNGNHASAVLNRSNFRPGLMKDASATASLSFGVKRVTPASSNRESLQYMLPQSMVVATPFLNHSNFTIFVVHQPSKDIPEGTPHGNFISNAGVTANGLGPGMQDGDARLVYGYSEKSKKLSTNSLQIIHDRRQEDLGKERYTNFYQAIPGDHYQRKILTVRLDTLIGTTSWMGHQKLFQSLADPYPMHQLDTLLIGSGLRRGFAGNIFEILIYNQSLTDQEISKVHDYLTKKYKLNRRVVDTKPGTFFHKGIKSFKGRKDLDTIRAATFYVDYQEYPGKDIFPETKVDSVQAFYDQWNKGTVHFAPMVYRKSWKRHPRMVQVIDKAPNGPEIKKTVMSQNTETDFSDLDVTHTIFPEIPNYVRASVSGSSYSINEKTQYLTNISIGNGVYKDPNYHRTMIHEYGHVFGLPDLYYENRNNDDPKVMHTNAVGGWSLMADLGSMRFLLWELYYLGWLSETKMKYLHESSWEGEVLRHEKGNGFSLIIIPEYTSGIYQTSFYCIEVPEKPHPDYTEGVLIYHVDTKIKTHSLPIKVMKQRLSETWEAPLIVGDELSEGMPFTVKVLSKTNEGYKIRLERK